MLGGHGHDVCECVENGDNMDVCVTEQNCEKLKDMLDPNKADIVPELENLKNAVNPNGEVGVLFKKNNGTYTNADIPPTNTPNVPVTSGGDTYGAAHTHPTFGGFPMFSWADVYVLANLYNNAATDVKNEVTYMMVGKETNLSAEASVYALVIEDIGALNAALSSDLFNIVNIDKTLNHSSTIKVRTGRLVRRQNLTYGGDNEAEFLSEFSGHGIKLFKAENDLSNWKELEYNPALNSVFENPCN